MIPEITDMMTNMTTGIIKNKIESKTDCYYTLKKGKKEESCVFIFDKKYAIVFKNKGNKSTFVISTEKKFLTVRKTRGIKKISLDDGVEKLMKIFGNPATQSFSSDEIKFGTMFVEKILEQIKRENIIIDPNVFNDLANGSSSNNIPPPPPAPIPFTSPQPVRMPSHRRPRIKMPGDQTEPGDGHDEFS